MILASQSPRRIELMREAGYNIRVIPADIDETPFDGEAPLTLVERLARAKAAAVAAEHAEPNELTVAADTIVTFDGQILGKPANEDEACTMLRELSGRTHTTNDGDTISTLASGKLGAQASAAVPLDLLGMLAVRALQTAIVNGAKSAKTSHGIPGAAK